MKNNTTINISAKRALVVMLSVAFGFLLIFYLSQISLYFLADTQNPFIRVTVYTLVDRFHMGGEITIPMWYNQLLLLMAGLLFLVIYVCTKSTAQKSILWLVSSVILILMSIDEAAQLHELMDIPTEALIGPQEGVFRMLWVIPAVIFLLLLTLVFFKFIYRLDSDTRKLLILGAVIFVGGAVGMEMIGAYHYDKVSPFVSGWDYMSFIYTGIEEFMEKAGVAIVIYAQLRYLSVYNYGLAFKIIH